MANHSRSGLMLAAALAVASPTVPAATAEITFVRPEGFTDVGLPPYSGAERDAVLEGLKRHLVMKAARALPQGETLSVIVTDVDLAGSYEPWQRGSQEVRIVREAYPPRIELRFRLASADGRVVKEGTRSLRARSLFTNAARYQGHALRFEKLLIDDWLEREFAPAQAR